MMCNCHLNCVCCTSEIINYAFPWKPNWPVAMVTCQTNQLLLSLFEALLGRRTKNRFLLHQKQELGAKPRFSDTHCSTFTAAALCSIISNTHNTKKFPTFFCSSRCYNYSYLLVEELFLASENLGVECILRK